MAIEDSIHTIFDKTNNLSLRKEDLLDDDTGTLKNGLKELNLKEKSTQRNDEAAKDDEQEKSVKQEVTREFSDLPKEWRYAYNHSRDLIIGNPSQEIRTRALLRDTFDYLSFVSQIEPKNMEETENNSN